MAGGMLVEKLVTRLILLTKWLMSTPTVNSCLGKNLGGRLEFLLGFDRQSTKSQILSVDAKHASHLPRMQM